MQNTKTNSWLDKLTAEHLLYGLLLFIGLGTRFYQLAQQPLSSIEATNAWPAWLAAANLGSTEGIVPTSAFLYTIHTTLFWLVGAGDIQARFLSALVGGLLVLLAWQLRSWLGRVSALVLALLLAIDPWLVAYSRLADSAILSIGLGLFALTGLIKLVHQSDVQSTQRSWVIALSITLGLLIISGPQGWNFLPVLVLFTALFVWPRGIRFGKNGQQDDDGRLFIPQVAPLLTIGAIILGATSWLARPEGLGFASASLTVWRQQFMGVEEMAYGLGWAMLRLVVDQSLLLVFGIVGLITLWMGKTQSNTDAPERANTIRSIRWRLFLTLWLIWGVILILLPGRNPFSLIMLVLPAIFLASHSINHLWHLQSLQSRWQDQGMLLATLAILSVTGVFWITNLSHGFAFEVERLMAALIVVVLMSLLLVLFALWSGWRQTRFVGGLFVFILLLVGSVSSSWQLNHRYSSRQPDGFFAQVSHPAVRMLAHDVEKLSAQRFGDAWSVPVLVEQGKQSDPVLGWYLRNMRRLSWVLSPKAEEEAGLEPVVIANGTAADATTLPENYLGSDYALYIRWLPTNLTTDNGIQSADPTEEMGFLDGIQERISSQWSSQLKPLLRWILFRESGSPPAIESVLLWTTNE